MGADLLDVVLVAALLLFAVSGYRQGLLVGVLSFVGFLGGGLAGARLAPWLSRSLLPGVSEPLLGLVVVVALACLGQALATLVGAAVRGRMRWHTVRVVDSSGGALVSALSVLLVGWLVGTAVVGSPYPALAGQVRRSAVLGAVDRVMPDEARTWFASFRRLVEQQDFPQVFAALRPPPVVAVPPPDGRTTQGPAVQAARSSIVKIVGLALSCNRRVEGSGFVYAPGHVLTNAHVVAGVRRPEVTVGGQVLTGEVVLYDPLRDVAVLRVPGLTAPALSFAGPADAGTGAVVAGFPEDGPFRAVPARVRQTQRARGPDIYHDQTVVREVYALRSVVRPGNSGGPLLSTDGGVYGVVFAAAVDDPETGYALTAGEVHDDAVTGAQATTPVSTRSCD